MGINWITNFILKVQRRENWIRKVAKLSALSPSQLRQLEYREANKAFWWRQKLPAKSGLSDWDCSVKALEDAMTTDKRFRRGSGIGDQFWLQTLQTSIFSAAPRKTAKAQCGEILQRKTPNLSTRTNSLDWKKMLLASTETLVVRAPGWKYHFSSQWLRPSQSEIVHNCWCRSFACRR